MKSRSLLVVSALILAGAPGARAGAPAGDDALPSPAPAAVVRQGAEEQAAREGKAVFLEFHASWCIWCRRLNAMITDPLVKPVWDKYFVTVEIDAMERGDKVSLENAGWDAVMKDYGATNAGLPYFVFLDPKGAVLGDCRDPDNMGYPGGKHDSAAFLAVVAKSAPSITRGELGVIQGYLDRNAYGAE
jgi:thiol:disulfide interchange protein